MTAYPYDFDGTLHVTETEIQQSRDYESDVSAYVPEAINLDKDTDSIGDVRPEVTKTNLIETHHLITFHDVSDEEWHDEELVASVRHFQGGVKQRSRVRVNVIEDEVSSEQVDDVVDTLRENGYTDPEISAILKRHADRIANPR